MIIYVNANGGIQMLKKLDQILMLFERCFSRKASFHWFVVIVTGLMIRSDHLGVTSIIRDLSLNPSCYESLIHFFVPLLGHLSLSGRHGFVS